VCLVISVVGGALVTGDSTEPPSALLYAQAMGVIWGLLLLLGPPWRDLLTALEENMPARVWRLLSGTLSTLAVLGSLVLVIVNTPWWYWLSMLVAIAVGVPLCFGKVRPALVRRFVPPGDAEKQSASGGGETAA
jgi:hypothetical protein